MSSVSKTLAVVVACVMLFTLPLAGQSSKSKSRARGRSTKAATTKAKPAPAPVPAPAPRQERSVPFRPGEVLTYDISYSGTVSAGEATISVRDKRASYNSTAYYIVAEGKPTGLLAHVYTLYYKADTLVDAFTLLPQRGSLYSLEGKRSRQKTTMFNQAARTGSYEVRTATLVTRPLTIAPSTYDALSALVALRAAPLRADARLTMPVSDSGRSYSVQFAVEGREGVSTAALTAQAWRVRTTMTDERGQPQGRPLFIWISDDARHVPMKLKAELPVGSFVLELRQIRG